MFTKMLNAPAHISSKLGKGRVAIAPMYMAASCGLAAAFGSAIAFAAPVNDALDSVFTALESIAQTVQTGITGIILPIGIAVCLYFVARMILASDAKDAAMYKKRAITVAILVAVAFAIPGLLAAMKTLGENVNGTLAGSTPT